MPLNVAGAGQQLGSYRLVRQIGRGGMGEVYLAEHLRIPKQAAIKILLPELCHDGSVVERFFNEARTASRIRHPGIVDILDCDVIGDRAFIVMELLDGESLGSFLRRFGSLAGELPFLLGVGASIASAIGAAHGIDIVHRDLKPDNVQLHLAHPVEPVVTVKVLDFGIAKLVRSSRPSTQTTTGAIIGTPRYMSPEQCRGRTVLDRRSDIYSLGCILYEAVRGGPMFDAEGVGDWIIAHVSTPPVPLTEVVPGVPPELDWLIQRMLAKDPEDRPHHMDEVLSGLRKCAASLGAQIERLEPSSPVRRFSEYALSGEESSLGSPGTVLRKGRYLPNTLLFSEGAPPDGKREPESSGSASAPTGASPPEDRARPADSPPGEPRQSVGQPFARALARTARRVARMFSGLGRRLRGAVAKESPSTVARDESHRRPAIPRLRITVTRSVPQDRLSRLIGEAIPQSLKLQQDLIVEFLSGPFAAPTLLSPGVLRFGRVQIDAFQSHEFLCVFLAGAASGGAHEQLGTRTFHNYVSPIERYLSEFDRDIPKVVIAITDSILLGAGVKQKIVQFRDEYGAVVVPIYTRDLKLAKRNGTVARLLRTKLQDHCPPNYFHTNAPSDAAGVFGVGDVLAQLINQIKNQAAVLAIYAPPCSGKTSLISLAAESLDGVVAFNEVRCLEPATHDVWEFVRSFATDVPEFGAVIPIRSLLHRHIEAMANDAKKDNLIAALVLEDADWLVGLLVDPGVDHEQRLLAREFWSALAEIARLKKASLVVTGNRTHLLRHRRFDDWESPVAGLVEAHCIPRLDPTTLNAYLETKGSAMNVFHSPAAVDAIYQLTAGHIYFVRRLCGRIVESGRKKSDPVAAIQVTETTVRSAAVDLISDGTSFYSQFFQPFLALEQDVLSAIAQSRPKSVATLARRLGRVADAEVVAALDAVMALGVAEAFEKRYRISVPVFGDWIRRNRPEHYRQPDQSRGTLSN